ncbi:hypothetical protein DsansV1_C08g0084161 [Dioscorea sansibarensis]
MLGFCPSEAGKSQPYHSPLVIYREYPAGQNLWPRAPPFHCSKIARSRITIKFGTSS